MRVLVCGGRKFNDYDLLVLVLDAISITVIIEGEASGADSLARRYGVSKGIEVRRCPADWNTIGRAAGPIRNQRMLDEERPDLVVAFPGNKGTADMIRRARKAQVPVIDVASML